MWGDVPRVANCSEAGILDLRDTLPLADMLALCENDPEAARRSGAPELPDALKTPLKLGPEDFVAPQKKKKAGRRHKNYRKRPPAIFHPDDYYATTYCGPENPQHQDTGLVRIKDPWGRDVLIHEADYKKLKANATAEKSDEPD